VIGNLPVAPAADRVDLVVPTFSHPTRVTNPLFPVSSQESVLLLGRVDGLPFRAEVTLLPQTRIIGWQGQQVEALVSQYAAFLDGRIHEVAYDYYAQADDGSVWYLGEDVFNFENGVIVDTHGTWIAGQDGPAAMIMPAHPKLGDTYRPENIPGLVFEEVTVRSVGQTLHGPSGTVSGALVVRELHMDGATETKTFAPGYGEFFTGGAGDVEALTLAVPTDMQDEPVPDELSAVTIAAVDLVTKTRGHDWPSLRTATRKLIGTWESYGGAEVPPRIEAEIDRSFEELVAAIDARDSRAVAQGAIDLARWTLDLQLLYRPSEEVNLARLDLWVLQLRVDAGSRDLAAVHGDFFAIDYVRDRVTKALPSPELAALNAQLEDLLGAIGSGDFGQIAKAAGGLSTEPSLMNLAKLPSHEDVPTTVIGWAGRPQLLPLVR
jgi:hypothetical protein